MHTNEVKGVFNATGANIYFQTKGTGENLLLLHAGIADSRMWDKEFHLFSEKYRVVSLDLPGFGSSEFTGGSYSYSNIINELLTYLDINSTHILAASFGAKIAIDFYLDTPEKCLSLALLSPALSGWEDSSYIQEYEEEEEKLLHEGKLEETAQFNYETWILRNRDPKDIKSDVKKLVIDMQIKALTKPEPEYPCEEMGIEDNILKIKDIQAPVLIINGKYDVQDFHGISELIGKELPSSKRITIPDAAHLANLESPDLFYELVSEFFSDNSNNS
ncbi:alpha/beta hydrolase [Niallia taxi]|uniref:alpha/beta fold hydrolase n=1 Tax=Niallia taxi TaxID=2499688 RepID=UPI00203FBA0C|nr:alpha/beta hydrolase [Niallia taxi]MCM3216691.1 alpha/beta hydrolase [Niallia taxi]